ncbi:phosphate ABC transporter substrate-binding protein PstS family protein [Lactobacillus sp. Sy-1]|uniref:phosphate ABC transporter substrate-binding protein PstS family protein n=1 Tax=Lactobacillus sp. Sy-1 TaxID=2109645 RepID=UPI001C5A9D7B|nr:phosphate ABC transporter substrate-binding protein PstS family protein [Lactobacillus sp. Sy-1]MBW1605371.1 phosphate ABC transporter substrate-binding protein PstS family protein [Lactobacillus sp. Sy-1]
MKKALSFVTILGVSGVLLAGCGNSSKSGSSSSSSSTKITAVGSTALQPLVEQAATDYQNANSGASITVQGGGSGTGLSQVQQKAVQIGNSDIFAEKQSGIKASELKDHQVAVVGMAPVVNKDAGVKNVTMDQLKKIFTGKITNWKQVGGKDEKISVVNRAKGSGTRATFEQAVLGGATAVKAQEQDSNGTVQKIVSSTPGAVSYLAFSFLNNKLQALSIDNVKPTDANVETNKWKIWSYEHMYTPATPNKEAEKFIKYIQSSKVQNGLVKKLGYISISNMKVTKDANNKVTNK